MFTLLVEFCVSKGSGSINEVNSSGIRQLCQEKVPKQSIELNLPLVLASGLATVLFLSA